MTQEEIKEILIKHELWLNGRDGGKRAIVCGEDLSHCDLAEANLRGADLSGSVISWRDLGMANLCDTNLRGAKFFESDLSSADLRGADLRDADLVSADLRGAKLSGAKMYKRDADKAYLTRAQRDSIIIVDEGQKHTMQTMTQEEIDEVLRKHALLLKGKRGGRRAIFAGVDLRNANLSNADLYGASFRDADLRGADLFGSDLRFAILYKAKIYKQDADNAFLSKKQRDEIIIVDDDQKEGVDA